MDVQKTVDKVSHLLRNVDSLTGHDVLVGVPASKSARADGKIGNADLAYVHENGSPANNIPARPFLKPGIKKARGEITAILRQGAMDALRGQGNAFAALNRAGMVARNAVVNAITDPDPAFVPLKPATIRARLRKTAAGRRQLRRLRDNAKTAGLTLSQVRADWATSPMEGGGQFIKPLLDTGQLRASITYIVR